MASVGKIEQYGLEERVLALHAQGYTTREIAEEISADGIVSMTHDTVARWLQGIKAERSEQVKDLVQEYLRKGVTRDLELMEQIRDQLNTFRLDDRLKAAEKLPFIRQLQRTLESRLRLAGVAENNTLPEFKDMTDDDLDEFIADTERATAAQGAEG